MATNPQYALIIRDHNFHLLGQVTDYLSLDYVANFNDVGTFTLTVRADCSMRPFLVKGNGLIVTRDAGDGRGAQTVMSGPFWDFERKGQDNTLICSGFDDLFWLKARQALAFVGANPNDTEMLVDSPWGFWKLSDTSGTSATDSSGNARNGTYSGGFTLSQTGLIQDTTPTATLFDGSTGKVTLPTPSSLTGNLGWTMEVLASFVALPTGANTAVLMGMGNLVTVSSGAVIEVNSAGQVRGNLSGGAVSGYSTLTMQPGVKHRVAMKWTQATNTLSVYLDGVLVSSALPGAQTLTQSNAPTIGCAPDGTRFAHAVIQSAALYTATLTDTRVALHGALPFSPASDAASDTRTNVASTVLWQFVNVNAGPGARTDRILSGLALAADPGIGTTVTGIGTNDSLLPLLQQVAIAGGDIGFRLIQTASGTLTFTIYQPVLRSNVIFSTDLRNLIDYDYKLTGPTQNADLVGGSTSGSTPRLLVESSDSTSISAWGRVEGFVNASQASDSATLAQNGTSDLATNSEQTNLSLTPIDTPAVQYLRDYQLGDIVTVQIDGGQIQDTVRQVHLQLESTDQELVTPALGNPANGQVEALFDAQLKQIAALRRRIARLETSR